MPQIKEMAEITFSIEELGEMVTNLIKSKSPDSEDISVTFEVGEQEVFENDGYYLLYALTSCVVTAKGAVADQNWAGGKKPIKKAASTPVRVPKVQEEQSPA
jgi:hypothetical protein